MPAFTLKIKNRLKYRRAEIMDLIHLNRISVASKKYWGYPEDWMIRWKDELTISAEQIRNLNIWVALLGNMIIGFCAISEKAESYDIEHHWILPEYIGYGYGRKLLNKAINMTRKEYKPLLVVADPNAEGFYKKMGFKRSHSVESFPEGRLLPVLKKDA